MGQDRLDLKSILGIQEDTSVTTFKQPLNIHTIKLQLTYIITIPVHAPSSPITPIVLDITVAYSRLNDPQTSLNGALRSNL